MLHIDCFTFNAFQENTYIIINEQKQCWIIDPGMYDNNEVDMLTKHIEKNNLKPQAIINTHTHLDHIFGVNALKNIYNIPFGIHKNDLPVLNGAAGAAMLFGFTFPHIPKPDFFIQEGEPSASIPAGIEVRLAPGHSPGSIVFYCADAQWLIGGDVLFNGSIGRTDLPGGNYEVLINSIRTQIYTLPNETVVYSGHGPSTSIGNEKLNNPFVRA